LPLFESLKKSSYDVCYNYFVKKLSFFISSTNSHVFFDMDPLTMETTTCWRSRWVSTL